MQPLSYKRFERSLNLTRTVANSIYFEMNLVRDRLTSRLVLASTQAAATLRYTD